MDHTVHMQRSIYQQADQEMAIWAHHLMNELCNLTDYNTDAVEALNNPDDLLNAIDDDNYFIDQGNSTMLDVDAATQVEQEVVRQKAMFGRPLVFKDDQTQFVESVYNRFLDTKLQKLLSGEKIKIIGDNIIELWHKEHKVQNEEGGQYRELFILLSDQQVINKVPSFWKKMKRAHGLLTEPKSKRTH